MSLVVTHKQLEENVRRILPRGLKQFDLNKLSLHENIIYVIGKRGTGKSTLIKSIVHHHRHNLDLVIALSRSEKANKFYRNMMIPKKYIKSTFDEDFLDGIFQIIKRNNSGTPMRTLIIFDDFAFLKEKFWKSRFVIDMMFMGRHFNIGVIFAVQYVMHIPLDARSNYTFAFALQDNGCDTQERLHSCFFSFIRAQDDFVKILLYFTYNRGVLVSDGMSNDIDITKCVSWMHPYEIKFPFLVGCRTYRSLYTQSQLLLYYAWRDHQTTGKVTSHTQTQPTQGHACATRSKSSAAQETSQPRRENYTEPHEQQEQHDDDDSTCQRTASQPQTRNVDSSQLRE